MTTLIEIGCSLPKEEIVWAIVEESCKETGDLLIGRSVYEEIGEVLFIIRLLHAANVNKHAVILGHALRDEVITSFQFVNCGLVQISFDPSLNIREQMRNFPLRSGESWFFAIHDAHQAYICISGPVLDPAQVAWLLEHDAIGTFV